jgi:hypothetical protein
MLFTILQYIFYLKTPRSAVLDYDDSSSSSEDDEEKVKKSEN